jgi:hypothetical protein
LSLLVIMLFVNDMHVVIPPLPPPLARCLRMLTVETGA